MDDYFLEGTSILLRSSTTEPPLIDLENLSQSSDTEETLFSSDYQPHGHASSLSKILFLWPNRLLKWSNKHTLHISQMGDIQQSYRVQNQHELLKSSWELFRNKPRGGDYQLGKAAIHAFRKEYLVTVSLNMVGCALDFSNPFLVNAIISFIQDPGQSVSWGFFLFFCLASVQFVSYLVFEQIKYLSAMTGVKSTNAMIALIYQKALRLSSATNKSFNQGEIVNFIQTDAQKLSDLSEYLPFVSRLPIALTICFVALFYYLGASVLSGLAVFGAGFLSNYFIANIYNKYQTKYMEEQDSRVNITTETLNQIKAIKLNSWVSLFEYFITQKRNKELSHLKMKFKLGITFVLNLYLLPYLLSTTVYSVYIGTGHDLDLGMAYTASILFLLMEEPLRTLPDFISHFMECLVSFKRMQQFLLCQEVNLTQIGHHHNQENHNSVEITGGHFSWGAKFEEDSSDEKEGAKKVEEDTKSLPEKILEEATCLKDMHLEVRKGEFMCIVGDVGAGKSSLLNSLLGDLLYLSGEFVEENRYEKLTKEFYDKVKAHADRHYSKQYAPVHIYEELSYVQQNPWIQNMSIRENILFGLPFSQEKYEETIDICELKRDLEILPNGDFTEIGEKGINLSGGQKARVSLARAVYSNKPIILMDDPISALDANVKKSIFEKVFMEKFKGKTRVLVTHALDFLEHVDTIVVMKKGRVVLKGSYQEVKEEQEILQMMNIHNAHQQQQQDIEGHQHVEEVKEEEANFEDSLSDTDSSKDSPSPGKERNYSAVDLSPSSSKMIEDENNEKAQAGLEVYKEFAFDYFGGWKHIITTQVLMVIFMVATIAFDYWTGYWAQANDQHARFGYYCGMKFLFLGIISICVLSRASLMMYHGFKTVKKLHEAMIRRVLNAPINLYFDVTPIGRILNRFSKDLEKIQDDLPWTISATVATFYITLSIILTSILAVPWIILIYPFVLYLMYKVFINSITGLRETARVVNITKSPIVSQLSETLAGTSTIRAFKKEKDFMSKFNDLLNKNTLACMWREGAKNAFTMKINFICFIILVVAFLCCILYRNSGRDVILSLLLFYLIMLADITNWFLQMLADIERQMVNVERCFKIAKLEIEKIEGRGPNLAYSRPQWPEVGEVEFVNVSLRYRPSTEMVLHNLSFSVKGGEKVGVVGRTGAGKSTICLSMSRIIELIEGSILIDGIDIKSLNLHQLRKRITVIPQDPTMFKGTLRFNLDPEEKAQKERILEVVKEAGLESLVDKNEKGLEQEVEEGGQNLSSGEKQLICICRAILRKSKVVILDEATANIDVVTEKKIQELIKLEFKDSTMITIAHRVNTIIESDRVLVLSFGQIVEFDSPQALIANPQSEFRKLLKEIKKQNKQ